MSTPFFSVVIPVYRRGGNFLSRAIDSVLRQNVSNIEIIIVDDNTEGDAFRREVREFFGSQYKDIPLRVEYHAKNSGACVARNTGISKAAGTFIAFLDSDDEWKNGYLENVLRSINQHPESDVFYSGYTVVSENGARDRKLAGIEGNILSWELSKDHISPTSCVVVRKTAFENYGRFDDKMPARQDYDMWLRLAAHCQFAFIDSPLVSVFRTGHESISSSYLRHVDGTERIAKKIESMDLDALSVTKSAILAGQYRYMARICLRNLNNKLCRKYSGISLSHSFSVTVFALWLFSFSPVFLLRLLLRIKSRFFNK